MTTLWPHQRAAADFLATRPGALLHMGMGTGKTLTVLEAAREQNLTRVLVLAPRAVVAAWNTQVERHAANSWRALPLDDRYASVAKKVEALKLARATTRVDEGLLVAINYESAWREPMKSELLRATWDLVVLDESHKVKDPWGVASKFVRALARKSPRTWALTGTPMPHSPLDAWAQFDAVAPGTLGWNFVGFRARYAVVVQMSGAHGSFPAIKGYRNQDELARRMEPFTFRAGRDVLKLPPAVHTRVPVVLGKQAARAYADLERDMRAQIEQGEINVSNALVLLLRLQQLTGGVAVTEDGASVIDTGKRAALCELFEDTEATEPWVVFARFQADLDAIHAAAKDAGRESAELSGRRKDLAAWQAAGTGEPTVIAVQIQAGGVGIDLTRACYCAFFSLGFSNGDYEQALARVHRPGQDRTTRYYHLVVDDTVDRAVYGALRQKREVVARVLDRIKIGHASGAAEDDDEEKKENA